LLLLPVPVVRLLEVSPDQLERTSRGAGGLGSTGR
jgi:dUTPase